MKILVIRLSSIGDVILTTPILRCLKAQQADCELHLITKPLCAQLLADLPFIDRIIEYDGSGEQLQKLEAQEYDCIIDLHNNHRSRRLRRALKHTCTHALKRTVHIYHKENLGKFALVLLKRDFMSGRHVVDRYFDAVKPLGVVNDGQGLQLPNFDTPLTTHPTPYVVIACGAQHETKRIPPEKIAHIANTIASIQHITNSVILVGDESDRKRMEQVNLNDSVINLCGKTTLQESAAIISRASIVVASDSAMMHVAAAYHRRVIAIWGCTSPRFGFWAYGTEHTDYTPEGLRCWPCRRNGSESCPKSHFSCMLHHDYDAIIEELMGALKGVQGS